MTGAVSIAGSVSGGAASATEVAEHHLHLASDAEPLNSFISLDHDAVLRRAAAVDDEPAGPLAGVPIALKDLIDQVGAVTTAGSSFYRHVAEHNATVVDRLETAGAVLFGRANLHEFAFGFSSENPWFGPVHNPWDPETSAGGSSGGSAAAVAAGIVPAAIGTDTGGSVRVPAALCGLVGLKVTHGRVPLRGIFPLVESLDTVGPIAGSVADAAAVYRAIAGYDPTDPWSAPRPVDPPSPVSVQGLRIGIPEPLTNRPLDTVTAHGFGTAVDRLSDAGAEVRPVSLPSFTPGRGMLAVIGAEAAAVHREWFTEDPDRYGEDLVIRISDAMAIGPTELVDGLRWRARLGHEVAAAFRDLDVLVTPTVAVQSKRLGIDDVETSAGPEPYRRALSWFTAPVNQAGTPAIALPIDAAGDPPPSVQFIAPWWQEERLLALGSALEAAGIVANRRPPQKDSTAGKH